MATLLFEQMAGAREKINQALVEKGLISTPIKHGQRRFYSSDKYPEEITEESVIAGVVAFAALNNIQGGSVADVWLYDLLFKYLREPGTRAEINKLIGRGD